MSDESGGSNPPGWYPDETGRQRWWDGATWGQYADQAAPPPQRSHCTNCGAAVAPTAVVCTSCGFAPRSARNFCPTCGTAAQPGQVVCLSCGTSLGAPGAVPGAPGQKDKTVAGILAILLGSFGAHKFYLGRNTPAIIMLVGSLVGYCCGLFLIIPFLVPMVFGVIGLVEGIMYLTKSDQEFQQTYVEQGKDWF